MIEDLLAELGAGNKFFAKIDLQATYNQVKLTRSSQPLTTIVTHVGTFMYTVMPFGVKTAPSAFQRIMKNSLVGCSKTLCYLDDILVAGSSVAELKFNLNKVKQKLKDKNILINEDKSVNLSEEISWLGYHISEVGIKPDPDKAMKIQEWKTPKSVPELRHQLGMVNYYQRYIPKMATISEPRHRLLRKGVKWTWGRTEEKS